MKKQFNGVIITKDVKVIDVEGKFLHVLIDVQKHLFIEKMEYIDQYMLLKKGDTLRLVASPSGNNVHTYSFRNEVFNQNVSLYEPLMLTFQYCNCNEVILVRPKGSIMYEFTPVPEELLKFK